MKCTCYSARSVHLADVYPSPLPGQTRKQPAIQVGEVCLYGRAGSKVQLVLVGGLPGALQVGQARKLPDAARLFANKDGFKTSL